MSRQEFCLRDFKNREADQVATSASIAACWTQRMVVRVAANNGWKLALVDVGTSVLNYLLKRLSR